MNHTLALRLPVFDPASLKLEFPVFRSNPDLVFLDTAASAQKPEAVIAGLSQFYGHDYANVHRGAYRLSLRATQRYEQARHTVADFVNATAEEIVFVRGATEAINLVANSWGPQNLLAGDEILISEMEHHANIVPWQMLRQRLGIRLGIIPMAEDGGLDLATMREKLSDRTRLVAITHVANVSGHVAPVAEAVRLAHAAGARILLDGCQAAPRMPLDMAELDCDFYVFSGHKCYGPTGIGVLYGRRAVLQDMPPWQGGGDMIRSVTFDETTYQDGPLRFEAGTPDIAGAVGLDLALSFMQRLGLEDIAAHEQALTEDAASRLQEMRGVHVVPAGERRMGAVSFTVDGIHPHDLATIFDSHNVAIRAGHHCAQPFMERLGLPATARASFGVYSTSEDIEALIRAVRAAQTLFGV